MSKPFPLGIDAGRNEPGALEKAAHFLFAKDWIRLKFTGRVATDPSDASRAPLDIRQRDYSQDLLEMLGQSPYLELFPQISETTEAIGSDIGEAAKQTLSIEASFQPNMANHQKYRELYLLYKGLYQHVWDMRARILSQMGAQTPQ